MKSRTIITSDHGAVRRRVFSSRSRFARGLHPLKNSDEKEVLRFLKKRSVHSVVMTSFIQDNGMESPNNRGKFYGCRAAHGQLEGVALIGHTTLVEAHSETAIAEFARIARESETPIHFMMSDGAVIGDFWRRFVEDQRQPRLVCTETLFEISASDVKPEADTNLRTATAAELLPVAEAHAEVALTESGVNPLERDREGFLRRTLKRIEKERTWVVFENGELLFKADVVAENAEVIYLEGIYVNPKLRGKGVASNHLAHLCGILLDKVKHVCLLSNVEFTDAHRAYLKAGFRMRDTLQTIFV